MINQLKGALKMFFLINIAIAALNIWILKDNRHVNLLLLGENCQAVAASTDQLAAVSQFGGVQ